VPSHPGAGRRSAVSPGLAEGPLPLGQVTAVRVADCLGASGKTPSRWGGTTSGWSYTTQEAASPAPDLTRLSDPPPCHVSAQIAHSAAWQPPVGAPRWCGLIAVRCFLVMSRTTAVYAMSANRRRCKRICRRNSDRQPERPTRRQTAQIATALSAEGSIEPGQGANDSGPGEGPREAPRGPDVLAVRPVRFTSGELAACALRAGVHLAQLSYWVAGSLFIRPRP
jgi:hypothetical protein